MPKTNHEPEISRMLTLSTAHLSEDTAEKLDKNPKTDCLSITCYPKSEFGWYVYFDGLPEDAIDHLPDDLKAAIHLAKNLQCGILCFDCDAEVIPHLCNYERN